MAERMIEEGTQEFAKVAMHAIIDSAEKRLLDAKIHDDPGVSLPFNVAELLISLARAAVNNS